MMDAREPSLPRPARGRFITVEGVDGAGKSSHIEAIAAQIRAAGHALVVTREPGGTPLGEQLRQLLLSEPMDIGTEVLLMFAARREHIVQVIEPALAAGRWVLSDRFTDATFAYQGAGRGLGEQRVAVLERWVQAWGDGKGDVMGYTEAPLLQPDLTLVFDVPVEVARQRLLRDPEQLDRFETELGPFHQRVRDEYLRRVVREPQRMRRIDSSLARPEVEKIVSEIIVSYCFN
jgi:dTMP kinase